MGKEWLIVLGGLGLLYFLAKKKAEEVKPEEVELPREIIEVKPQPALPKVAPQPVTLEEEVKPQPTLPKVAPQPQPITPEEQKVIEEIAGAKIAPQPQPIAPEVKKVMEKMGIETIPQPVLPEEEIKRREEELKDIEVVKQRIIYNVAIPEGFPEWLKATYNLTLEDIGWYAQDYDRVNQFLSEFYKWKLKKAIAESYEIIRSQGLWAPEVPP